MSIHVNNLSKHFGQQKAVDNISFQARPGKILGFLGPNGAGKSTTMKMLTGYLTPNAGDITICGLNLCSHPLQVKALVGYLPENTPLYTDMYVREFLLFIAQIYKLDNAKKSVEHIIEQVGLGSEQYKKINMLSKGYKQRVGLAQAIIHDPKVLILDEPSSGLDPNQLADVRQLIKNLGRDKTVILSTHIMQEVEALCDDLIVINHGKIVANSDLASLKANHSNNSLEDIFKKLTVDSVFG